jgi:protein-L-isoaspartate(D-aspartate) O-methyltransferase
MDEAVPAVEPAGGQLGRFLLAPRTFAKLVQLAEIGPETVVLDVGCATGYSTAVLAQLAKAVVAVEVDAALAAGATQTLRQLGVNNALVIEAALEKGAPSHAPFGAILLNGAVPRIPQELLEQLEDGGRLVAVIADGAFGRAQVWRRTGKAFDPRPVFDAGAQPLPGFSRQVEFVL